MAFPADYTLLGKKTLPTITGSHSNFVQLYKYDDFDYTYQVGDSLTGNMLDYIDNGGGDLRFSSDEAGTNQLPIEVVEFDNVGNSIQVWVRIPTAATGEEIFIWGDNTGDSQPAVTDTYGRNAVYTGEALRMHFESASGPVDSSGNATITTIGTPTDTTGKIDGASDIGLGEGYETSDISQFDFSNGYTVSFWANISDLGDFAPVVRMGGNFQIRRNSTSQNGLLDHAGGLVFISNYQSAFSIGTLNKYNMVWDESDGSFVIYRDGVLTSASATLTTYPMTASPFQIFYENPTRNIQASALDEFVFKNGKTTQDHILTEYQNQSSVGEWGVTSGITSTGITVTVQGLSQSQTLDNITITQKHILALQSISNIQTLDNISLTGAIELLINDASQSQTIDNISLTENQSVSINELNQNQTLDNINLTQANSLTLADLSQSQLVDLINLVTGDQILINEVSQAQAISNVEITQAGVIVLNTVTQQQLIDQLTLQVMTPITVKNLSQSQLLDNVDLDVLALLVQINDATQTQTIDNITLTQTSVIQIDSMSQNQIIDSINFGGVVVGYLEGELNIFYSVNGDILIYNAVSGETKILG